MLDKIASTEAHTYTHWIDATHCINNKIIIVRQQQRQPKNEIHFGLLQATNLSHE